ncbi:MAG TPA: organomercurial lyase [Gaiella sp.]|nr:organomercurial lyase [Gaiella sp.]
MDAVDLTLRNNTYTLLVRLGRGPTAAELATETGMAETAVQAGWKRLHEQHAIVLGSDDEIRMANPFSAVPTSHRVEAAGRSWYANCAWDAFGVCAALDADGHIETTCPDCGEQLVVEVRDGRPDDESLVFHSLVDAGHWWDDIVFT